MHLAIVDILTLQEKPISKSEYELIAENMDFLNNVAIEIDYYRLVKYNISNFVDLQKSIKTLSYDNFMILNSGFANWLNSYYMWVSFHNHNFDTIFSELKSKYRKEYTVFKLADVLRHFETHDSFAITEIEHDILTGTTSYIINFNNVIERWSKEDNYKKWMLKKSTSGEIAKSIDAIVFTCNFEKIFESAQLEIWDCLRDSIKDAFKACNSVLNFDYSNIYNLTIRTGKTTIYPFGRRFSIVHEKIKSNCPNIAI